ncbi:hypothetical protein [Nonomuraea sp. NPDC049141]
MDSTTRDVDLTFTFTFTDQPTRSMYLSMLVVESPGLNQINHYQVSELD